MFGHSGVAGPLTRVGPWQAIASILNAGVGQLNTTIDEGLSWASRWIPVKLRPGDSLYASPFSETKH